MQTLCTPIIIANLDNLRRNLDGGSPLALVLRPSPFLSYNGNASLQANWLSVFFQILVHIHNYAYSFGAGRRREIKGILVYQIARRQTGMLDITMFSLLLPIGGLPLGFMQNNGSASAGLAKAFTYRICLCHRGRIQYCLIYIHFIQSILKRIAIS